MKPSLADFPDFEKQEDLTAWVIEVRSWKKAFAAALRHLDLHLLIEDNGLRQTLNANSALLALVEEVLGMHACMHVAEEMEREDECYYGAELCMNHDLRDHCSCIGCFVIAPPKEGEAL